LAFLLFSRLDLIILLELLLRITLNQRIKITVKITAWSFDSNLELLLLALTLTLFTLIAIFTHCLAKERAFTQDRQSFCFKVRYRTVLSFGGLQLDQWRQSVKQPPDKLLCLVL